MQNRSDWNAWRSVPGLRSSMPGFLWEIRQILNKNNNINLYTTKDKQYFSQQLEIYY